jgi:hypothetical protein
MKLYYLGLALGVINGVVWTISILGLTGQLW